MHGLLTDRSGNPKLTKLPGQLWVKFRRIALACLGGRIIVERFVVDHGHMIDVLRVGNHKRAAELSESHWRSSYNRFSNHVKDAEMIA